MKRILKISYSTDKKEKYEQFQKERKRYRDEFFQRNLEIISHRTSKRQNLFLIELYGYDGLLKYQTNKISSNTFPTILSKIDKMPMGKIEKKSFDLYTDAHPKTTLQGVGFKDADTAIRTIQKVEESKKSDHHKYLIIHTMFYRAKYHPNQTKDMKEAMKIFKDWLDKKKKKQKGGSKLPYLPLSIIKPFEQLADYYGVSKKARGLEKPTTTDEGFLVIYKKIKGDSSKLKEIPCKKLNPNGVHWDRKRDIEVKGKFGQMKRMKIPLYQKEGPLKGLPTKMHVIMVMWGYSPDPKGLKKSMRLLKGLPK
jgi:hypothetical protein